MGAYVDWFSDFQGNSWFCEHVTGLKQKIFTDRLHEQMALGEPCVTWEFNQHEHLVELGKAYWLVRDERYSCEYVIQLVDWIEKNHCLTGINWVDERSVAQRTINWVLAFHFFLPSDHVSPSCLLRALKALTLHGAYLWNYLKSQPLDERPLYRLTASVALAMLAWCLQELQTAREWQAQAGPWVTRAVLEEFTADGGHRSGSVDSHRVALELALMHYLLAMVNGESADNMPTAPRLLDALRFLTEMTTPALTVQPVGSGLPSRALPFGMPFTSDHRAVMAIGAVLFHRPDFKYVAGEVMPWHLTWLMGPTARERYAALPAQPPTETCSMFAQSGWMVLREGWGPKDLWLLFRCGGPAAAEHDDRFHVSLAVGGETVLTDLGTYAPLTEHPSWFDHARAHNVLAVRHTRPLPGDPSDTPTLVRSAGRIWLKGGKRRYRLDRHARLVSPEALVKSLDAEQPDVPVEYRREILIDAAEKWVAFRDVLEGSGDVQVDALFYHLPGLDLVQRGDQGCVLWKKGAWLRIQPYFPGQFRWHWDRPREHGHPPFWCPDGTRLLPAYALRYHSTVSLPTEVFFWIHWDAGAVPSPDVEDIRKLFYVLPARA
jgi:hypothetical protein